MQELMLAMALMELLEKLMPRIEERFRAGEITAEAQQSVRNQYNANRAKLDELFSGPGWKT